jgi:photosystem II stability/assembly factor-like uncharacterized protein
VRRLLFSIFLFYAVLLIAGICAQYWERISSSIPHFLKDNGHNKRGQDEKDWDAVFEEGEQFETAGFGEDEVFEEEEGRTDEPGKFLQFHSGIRTREGEAGPAYKPGYKWQELSKAVHAARLKSNKAISAKKAAIAWNERGPANVPGRTRTIYNIPGDPANKTWLVGAATGGIWRTTDGGNSWSEQSIGFPTLPISSIAANASGSVIYAGTGEFVSSFYSAIGNGIFKSFDKGITWTQIPATNNHPDFAIITRLIVNPNNANIVVATTVPHNLTTDNTSAIMRSEDGGSTWTKVKEIEGMFEQVTFTPSNFNIQYASEHGVGVWKSTDAGITWNLSNNGMFVSGRVEISVSPTLANVVFASSEGNVTGTGSDLYYSPNAGSSWSLVDVKFNNNAIDFLDGQGYYDNTVMCDPFSNSKLYVGGVSLFKVTLTSGTSLVDYYRIQEWNTESFIFLQSFSGIPFEDGRLDAKKPEAGKTNVEIRFGPGQTQKAHRFFVPPNKTNGLSPTDYTYQSYVDVPFEVWDVTNNRQLMASFRDQNRNGKFDLLPEYLTNGGTDYLLNSREYIYVHNETYNSSAPSSSISQTGGQSVKMMYNIFPALASEAVWNESNLPASKIIISYNGITRYNASTETVADGRGQFDGKNIANQVDLTKGVHPDHHCLIPVIETATAFKLLLGNDGGVFVSKAGASPGTSEGDWLFKGYGLNTTQFYGADKRPGADQYIGGAQDNGTRISPSIQSANATSNYFFAIDGDGFECIWNSRDPEQLLGTKYYGQIVKSSNEGATWSTVAVSDNTEFPFVTKLANSKDYPNRTFTAGTKGVYVSQNFGDSWTLVPIASKFVIGSALYLDAEVSRANANVVWAGSGMNSIGNTRNLFVSTDGGKSFRETQNYTAVTLGNITRLASHPVDDKTAYALFSFADSPKILRTTDLGESWEDISGFGTMPASNNGFPDVAVYCLYVRPDDPNVIWAGTEIGIVESQNNGASWTLLEDFPHVAVWDMKGQDDQVVIATHGRGIWTATIGETQTVVQVPEISTSGTTPAGNFAIRYHTNDGFDSVAFYANGLRLGNAVNVSAGTFDIEFNQMQTGIQKIMVVGYRGSTPYQSLVMKTEHFELTERRNFYSTYFRTANDLAVAGMTINVLQGPHHPFREALQTEHPNIAAKPYSMTIKTPVVISAELPFVYIKDIAVVEPANAVVVEATLNGLDWTNVKTYDASEFSQWQDALSNAIPGDNNLYAEHEIDLTGKFTPGDVVLFRLRLASGAPTSNWGWAIEYVSIQEVPTAVEHPVINTTSVYPNPSAGKFNVQYFLSKPSPVSLHIVNGFGQKIMATDFGVQHAGKQNATLDLSGHRPGTYIIILKTGAENVIRKITVADK